MDGLIVVQKMKPLLIAFAALCVVLMSCAPESSITDPPSATQGSSMSGDHTHQISATPTPTPTPTSTRLAAKDGYCEIHNTPLIESDGYWTGEPVPMIRLTPAYIKHASSFPHRIRLSESLKKSDFTPHPHKVRYCKECEMGLKNALNAERPSQ